MVLRPQDLPLRHKDAIIDLKNQILLFRNIKVALSKIDDGEYEKHGVENWGPTFETPGYKNDRNIPFYNFGISK